MNKAVATIAEFPGGTLEQYNKVIDKLGDLGQHLTEGGIFHMAGAMEGGIRIIDVWESEEAFKKFYGSELFTRVMKEVNVPPPKVTVWPVHNFMR